MPRGTLPLTKPKPTSLGLRVRLPSGIGVRRRIGRELKVRVMFSPLFFGMRILLLNFAPPFYLLAELEKKVAEATSAADALRKSLDAEVSERSALEAVVASVCERLGVEASASVSSLQSRVGALYSRAGERLREALHAGVKKALAMVSSHYVSIDLPRVSEGYVLPDDKAEAQEELQKLGDATYSPGDALATFFDAKVELPPRHAGSWAVKEVKPLYLFSLCL